MEGPIKIWTDDMSWILYLNAECAFLIIPSFNPFHPACTAPIIKGDSLFCATGITNSDILNGVKIDNKHYISETLVTHKNSNLKEVIKNVIPLNEW